MLFPDFPNLEYLMRLVIAGLLGGLIGLDREYRAKEAGIRTHFLVVLGSTLIMIVSQHGFSDVANVGWIKLDPSRVAAQIVSGIGFLGAGIIIFQKQAVKGLTTAAGLWVSAGIGMAVGGGMYLLACAATVLTLICFELLQLSSAHLGLITQVAHITFLAKSETSLNKTISSMRAAGCRPANYSFKKEPDGSLKVSMFVRYQVHNENDDSMIRKLEKLPGVKLERFE